MSHMTYAILVWGKSSVTLMKKIISVQNWVIKLIYGTSSNQTYFDNNIMRVIDFYDYCALLKLFKEKNNVDDAYFFQRLNEIQVEHTYETRFAIGNNFVPPFYIRSTCTKSFLKNAIGLWNTLPSDLKNSRNINILKKHLRKYNSQRIIMRLIFFSSE